MNLRYQSAFFLSMQKGDIKKLKTMESFNYTGLIPHIDIKVICQKYMQIKEREMLILQNTYRRAVFFFALTCASLGMNCDASAVIEKGSADRKAAQENERSESKKCKKRKKVTYYLYTADFINSLIDIQTTIPGGSSTTDAKYLAGRAPIYNRDNEKVGTCSASFLCMQTADGIYTDISNYLSADNGLVISWFTPTTLINLLADSIVHSMVTECIVVASTKIGFNPYYGDTFNMVVSSDETKIYFKLTEK